MNSAAAGDYSDDIIAADAGTLYLAMNDHTERNNQAGKVVAQVILFD